MCCGKKIGIIGKIGTNLIFPLQNSVILIPISLMWWRKLVRTGIAGALPDSQESMRIHH
jgi:hypothetical protein